MMTIPRQFRIPALILGAAFAIAGFVAFTGSQLPVQAQGGPVDCSGNVPECGAGSHLEFYESWNGPYLVMCAACVADPTCADYGQVGTYPDCSDPPPPPPPPTCADSGQLGTYPDCYDPPPPPTCADSGQLGTYPDCYDPPSCVSYQGQSCNASNSCGSHTNYGTYQCDGSCSVSAPSDSLCPASQPDLRASSISAPNSITFRATITNNGSASTGSSFTNVFQYATNSSGSGATVMTTDTSPTLSASGSDVSEITYTLPSSGTWYIRACADSNASFAGTISESNEGNNCGGWTAVNVSVPSTPTVSCTSPSGTISAGQSVTWTSAVSGFSGTPSYSWSSTGASPSSGSSANFTTSYASNGNYSASVTATYGAQSDSTSCTAITVGSSCGSADITLTATPARVQSGGSTTITWSATGVTQSCTLSGTGATSQTYTPDALSCTLAEGTTDITNIQTQLTYTLDCGSDGSETVVVNLVPSFEEF